MFRVLTCLTTEHDARIVLVAVLMCAATALTCFRTYTYALSCTNRRRNIWIAVAGLVAASGIWGTHFIAMLAYQPQIPTAYNLGLTALSFGLASVATTLGLWVNSLSGRHRATAAGAIIGGGISVMHFAGMRALEVAGDIVWDPALIAAAGLAGVLFSIASLRVFAMPSLPCRKLFASGLLVLAIAGMHFTGMSAAQIIYNPAIEIGTGSMGRIVLAMCIFIVSSLALMAGVVAVLIGRIRDQRDIRTADLRAEIQERRLAAVRTTQQQAILGAVMSNDSFRHAPLHDAIAALNEAAVSYETIDVSYAYHVSDNGTTLEPLHCFDRRQTNQVTIEAVPTSYFVASGEMNEIKSAAVYADLQSDPRIAKERLAYTVARGLRAAIDLPIEMDGRVVGVYCLRSCDKHHSWTQDEQLFATSLANLASLAFERDARQKIGDELLIANRAAHAASKAKSQFLANMSHEIRTPMNGVFGMTDLLSRTSLDERQKRLVGTIGQSARTLLTIINDVLDLSRIEEGMMSLDSHEYDLASSVEDSVALLAEEAQKKDLDLNLYIDESVSGSVTGDSVRLRQVMLNLMGNAIKFTANGEVTIRVTPANKQRPVSCVRFEVRDTGIGIDAAVIDTLFQPFAQADSTISRRFGGTGLGLSISRHLVTMMGGKFEISSELGKGTCIAFELPMTIAPVTSATCKSASDVLSGQRILVVDDRATNREIICSYLSASGVQAEAADGSLQALAMLEAAATVGQPFAQAIVDLVMPDIDGLELCRRISSSAQLKSTQLILLSSLSWSQDLTVARQAGVERLLHKPIRRNELVTIVTELLTRHQNMSLMHQEAATAHGQVSKSFFLKVLVAEDNPVNQVIAAEYLAILGCAPTVVENGLQALAAFEREHFDVILMDCQMPEMDGLQATRLIRERERETKAARTPIVAVTANAFEEDRQRCLAAGMDSYIRKPFSENDLATALSQWRPAAVPANKIKGKAATGKSKCAPAQRAKKVAASAETDSVVLDGALKSARPGLHAKLVEAFLDHAPKLMPILSRAVRMKDLNALMMTAHSVKSSSANVGATNVSEQCRSLETAARSGDLESSILLVATLERSLLSLCAKLKADRDHELKASVA